MSAAHSAMWLRATTAAVMCGMAVLAGALPAHGVLPPAFGGVLHLPLAAPLDDVDPARQALPSSAAVSAALFDTLYALDARGAPVPVLAEALPTASTTPGAPPGTLQITLRSALRRHDGGRLVAADVVAALQRAATMPRAGWLLGAFARTTEGALDIRAAGPLRVEMRPAREGLDLARVLAARPLAIVVGDPSRRVVGTGRFSLRGTPGGTTRDTVLVQYRRGALGAAYLERVALLPPRARDEDLRALELGTTDASWFGATLFAPPAAGTRASTEAPSVCPILLVASDTGALRDEGLRGYVAASMDRRRLERAGLLADTQLAGLAVGAPPAARAPTGGPNIRLAVPSGDPLLARVAEVIAAMLDERGVGVVLSAAPAVDPPPSGTWDARLVSVLPPLAGQAAVVGAALAAAGRTDAARALAASHALDDARGATEAARTFEVLVLGRRRETLYYQSALRGVRFDTAMGTLELANISLARVFLPATAPVPPVVRPRARDPRGPSR